MITASFLHMLYIFDIDKAIRSTTGKPDAFGLLIPHNLEDITHITVY